VGGPVGQVIVGDRPAGPFRGPGPSGPRGGRPEARPPREPRTPRVGLGGLAPPGIRVAGRRPGHVDRLCGARMDRQGIGHRRRPAVRVASARNRNVPRPRAVVLVGRAGTAGRNRKHGGFVGRDDASRTGGLACPLPEGRLWITVFVKMPRSLNVPGDQCPGSGGRAEAVADPAGAGDFRASGLRASCRSTVTRSFEGEPSSSG